MFKWPFNKKNPEPKPEHVIKPSEDWIKGCSEGNIQCVYLPYQYINWCYEYLDSDVKVKPHTPCFNKHVIIMTGACVKYMEDKT